MDQGNLLQMLLLRGLGTTSLVADRLGYVTQEWVRSGKLDPRHASALVEDVLKALRGDDPGLEQQAERQQQNAALKQQILEGIAPVIRKELKSALPPLLKNSMQEVASQVILPAIQKSSSDSAGGVATAVAGNLQGPMQDAFRAGIISSVLPALEGAIQQATVAVLEPVAVDFKCGWGRFTTKTYFKLGLRW